MIDAMMPMIAMASGRYTAFMPAPASAACETGASPPTVAAIAIVAITEPT